MGEQAVATDGPPVHSMLLCIFLGLINSCGNHNGGRHSSCLESFLWGRVLVMVGGGVQPNTSQELRMQSSVTLYCQVTIIVVSQFAGMSPISQLL